MMEGRVMEGGNDERGRGSDGGGVMEGGSDGKGE